ncbi:ribonuclease P protein component [Thermosynechococcaceae cyanobacterium BACA0444]|uniref:Ribonuclease P protein component n=1 Tax=Pseudocalidococcus azoricus BACA0444 TaxID=2918990 RepID=A0AAE4FQB7_9CYAN|nr:ribonuclease P protein component [Pseudocalidococcus azoricus]MDS3859582.1 ribonuclease P protein component [Pseudocalidococcus azoricus BACA0444]
MLPGPHRLRSRHDFNHIYKEGKSWHGPYFVTWLLPRATLEPGLPLSTASFLVTRIGLVVGKKVSKLAIRRNWVKRRMRQACWELLKEIEPGWDVILVARRAVLDLQANQYLPELEQLLAQAGILHGH